MGANGCNREHASNRQHRARTRTRGGQQSVDPTQPRLPTRKPLSQVPLFPDRVAMRSSSVIALLCAVIALIVLVDASRDPTYDEHHARVSDCPPDHCGCRACSEVRNARSSSRTHMPPVRCPLCLLSCSVLRLQASLLPILFLSRRGGSSIRFVSRVALACRSTQCRS